jgi:hypothetical protein
MPNARNLAQRPAKPALGRGRLQRAARRAFLAGNLITTGDVAEVAFVRRLLLLHGRKLRPYHYRRIRRVLAAIAEPVRRVPPHGAWLWRLRHTAGE